jgi:hypothetical protein
LFGEHRVVGQHRHLEPCQPLDDQLADVTQADDPHRLAGQLAAHQRVLLPLTGARGVVAPDHVAVRGQDEGDHLLGHRVGVGPRGVHHVDAAAAGGLGVDALVPRAGPHHQLELAQGIEQGLVHPLAAHDQGRGIGVGGGEFVGRRLGVLHDLEAMRAEGVRGNAIELGGDQNLAHLLLVPVRDRGGGEPWRIETAQVQDIQRDSSGETSRQGRDDEGLDAGTAMPHAIAPRAGGKRSTVGNVGEMELAGTLPSGGNSQEEGRWTRSSSSASST